MDRRDMCFTASVALLLLAGCGRGEAGGRPDTILAQEVGAQLRETAEATSAAAAPALALQGTASEAGAQEVDASRTTALVRAAERVSPSVVSVNTLREQQVRPRSFWDQFFLPPGASRRSTGYGSGIIFHEAGYILTNDHVIREAEEIRVTLPDGRDFPAELVGSDGMTDVAVLQVQGEDLPVAPLGTSQGLMIGEWTIAIGNPFAYLLSNSEPTVTAGVVSAVGRHIIPQDQDQDQGFYLGMIQTDASINPGNSGGPLVNALGEVIGLNTSIFSRSGGSEGLGFAIPIDRVLRVAADIMQFGEVRRAWTGVDVEAVAADVWGRTRGVQVASVAPGSPAAEAGLSKGDRLLEANDRALGTPLDFEAVLLDLRAGDPVRIRVDGRSQPVTLVTETLPTARAHRVEVLEDLEVISVTPEVRAEQGISSESGALITGISQALSQSLGLREGDVLLGINNTRINTAEEAAEAIRNLQRGVRVRIFFERNGAISYLDFYTRR
ncbi:MAG: trypsin-like peptidase domain-containing protein [Gemmatimonadota bacterium]|jgi:serine protease Do